MNVELGFYKHYKNGAMYEVTETDRTNKTTMNDGQRLISYHAVVSGKKYSRSKAEFTEQVMHNGKMTTRYIKVDKEKEPLNVSGPVPFKKTGEWLHDNLTNGKKDK